MLRRLRNHARLRELVVSPYESPHSSHARRSAADRGQRREVAGAAAKGVARGGDQTAKPPRGLPRRLRLSSPRRAWCPSRGSASASKCSLGLWRINDLIMVFYGSRLPDVATKPPFA
jgi:hypothetical protein